jgi:hypothetical protein
MEKNSKSQRLLIRFLTILLVLSSLFVFVISGDSSPIDKPSAENDQKLNTLTEKERSEGWILLFDGKSFVGWRGVGREGIPQGHWIIEEESIKKVPSGDVPLMEDGQPRFGGDILTERTFENFEFSLEWKISPRGNSGIKYNVSEEMSTSHFPPYAALGFEYQVLDDDRHPDAKNGENRTAAALYDLIAPRDKILKPVGEFNTARIVFVDNHGEHWLNGIKVLEYDLETPEMDALLKKSKYRNIPGFAEKRKGHIVLQDHTDMVWYRNIKIREIKSF